MCHPNPHEIEMNKQILSSSRDWHSLMTTSRDRWPCSTRWRRRRINTHFSQIVRIRGRNLRPLSTRHTSLIVFIKMVRSVLTTKSSSSKSKIIKIKRGAHSSQQSMKWVQDISNNQTRISLSMSDYTSSVSRWMLTKFRLVSIMKESSRKSTRSIRRDRRREIKILCREERILISVLIDFTASGSTRRKS